MFGTLLFVNVSTVQYYRILASYPRIIYKHRP
jgi:hypothetical protein